MLSKDLIEGIINGIAMDNRSYLGRYLNVLNDRTMTLDKRGISSTDFLLEEVDRLKNEICDLRTQIDELRDGAYGSVLVEALTYKLKEELALEKESDEELYSRLQELLFG